MVQSLNEKNFQKKVIESKKLVLVDFWAPWCGPCQIFAPILEEIEKEFEEKIKVYKINVDENQNISNQYQIEAIPTIFIFKDGKIIDKIIGLITKEELKEKINSLSSK